jgi:hypothetical protein
LMPGTVIEAAERVGASTGSAVERASVWDFVLETTGRVPLSRSGHLFDVIGCTGAGASEK